MKAKPLIETNPYMKDPVQRKASIMRSTRTSGGVEGIRHSGSKFVADKESKQKRTK